MLKTTLEIQKALKKAGFDPGELDGRRGAATKRAIKQFQIAKGLTADGIYGPNTEAALFPKTVQGAPEEGGVPIPPPSSKGGPPWPREKDVAKFYGGIGMHQTTLHLPYPMRIAWDKKTIIRRFSIHEKAHDSALRVFNRIADAFTEAERIDLGIDLFGGCLNVRRKRGGTSYSMHSWGIAIDFDPERNQLKWGKPKARLSHPDAEPFWKLWTEEGWTSLGRERDFDWMHVEAARL